MSTPYIALYATDFLAGVGHLGNTELGIYWRLLLIYYRDARPLPFDSDRLRRLAMTFSPEEFRSLDAVISEFFVLSTEPDGTRVWRHKRADKELASAAEKHDSASKKAFAAANARWARGKPADASSMLQASRDAPSIAQAMPEAMLEQCQPEPEPEPEKTKTPSPAASGTPETDGFAEFWKAWPNTDRKADRKKCAEKWRRCTFGKMLPAILANIAALKSTRKWSDGFEPSPLTYLNGERWSDGVDVASHGEIYI